MSLPTHLLKPSLGPSIPSEPIDASVSNIVFVPSSRGGPLSAEIPIELRTAAAFNNLFSLRDRSVITVIITNKENTNETEFLCTETEKVRTSVWGKISKAVLLFFLCVGSGGVLLAVAKISRSVLKKDYIFKNYITKQIILTPDSTVLQFKCLWVNRIVKASDAAGCENLIADLKNEQEILSKAQSANEKERKAALIARWLVILRKRLTSLSPANPSKSTLPEGTVTRDPKLAATRPQKS